MPAKAISGAKMKHLLGIDIGTTGLKAGIFDLRGSLIGRGYAANQYLSGPTGSAEQDPKAWWVGACQAIQTALNDSGIGSAEIAAIGVCGFHHCPVFLDSQGEPTRPCIVTHDVRLSESYDDLGRQGILEPVTKLSGSLVTTGHFPPIYHFVRRDDSAALARTRWIMLAKDYIRFRLTGRIGTEICDATGTNLIAMPDQQWSGELCRLVGVDREKLPEIGTPSSVFGSVTKDAAQASGLKAGIPVVYGGGDSHCALVGLGVIGSGEVGMLLGTNSTLRASFTGYVDSAGHHVWKQQHVVPGKFTVSASSMAGSSVLSWFKDMFCGEYHSADDEVYRKLELLAEEVSPGSDGLFFHPYLHGERSPFRNPNARGSFLGIAHWHKKGHFARSVMEGVAFCIANCFDTINDIARRRNEQISTVRTGESGGARIKLWRQIIADVLGTPIEVVATEEAGCLGAALLAGVGIAEYRDIPDAIGHAVRIAKQVTPDPGTSAIYREARNLFNRVYRTIEPILYK